MYTRRARFLTRWDQHAVALRLSYKSRPTRPACRPPCAWLPTYDKVVVVEFITSPSWRGKPTVLQSCCGPWFQYVSLSPPSPPASPPSCSCVSFSV